MRVPQFLTRSRNVIALTLVGVTAGLGLGLGLSILQAQGTPDSNPTECTGFGSADFVAAESVDDLVAKADLVVKGRIIGRSNRSDQWRVVTDIESIRYLFYEVEVLDTLIGQEPGPTLTLGLPFGEVCLDPGREEYYLFVARAHPPSESYADDPEKGQNPAAYGLAWYGPQNVFTIKSGRVSPLQDTPWLEQYKGISEQDFAKAVLESADGIPRFGE